MIIALERLDILSPASHVQIHPMCQTTGTWSTIDWIAIFIFKKDFHRIKLSTWSTIDWIAIFILKKKIFNFILWKSFLFKNNKYRYTVYCWPSASGIHEWKNCRMSNLTFLWTCGDSGLAIVVWLGDLLFHSSVDCRLGTCNLCIQERRLNYFWNFVTWNLGHVRSRAVCEWLILSFGEFFFLTTKPRTSACDCNNLFRRGYVRN